MCYEVPDSNAPIGQGDIFVGVPKVVIEFAEGLPTVPAESGVDAEKTPWEHILTKGEPTFAVLPVQAVPAIIASQDCDAKRQPNITLCEIRPFAEIEMSYKEISNLKRKVNFVTRQACINLKWFYLPLSGGGLFEEVMAVDFLSTINVPREELQKLLYLRKARLREVARDHFRERIAQFYRRYAYNEWYPLNKEEMAVYAREKNIAPSEWYEWQK